MSSVGLKINQFDVPVCNSFQAKILNAQLCYEVDLNKYSNANNKQNELSLGFSFLMDYNEDRQIIDKDFRWQMEDGIIRNETLDHEDGMKSKSLVKKMLDSDHTNQALIYLDSMGNIKT